MVSFNKYLLLPLIISQALATSIFAAEEQSPLKSNTLPGEKPIPGGSPVSTCDVLEKQLLTIDLVELSPEQPQRGANLTVNAIGHLSADVAEGAYVDVDVRYGYIKLISQTYDLCSEVGEVDLECPLSKGEYKLTKTVEIPNEVPPGRYVVYARAYTKDDEFIACITATVVFTVDSLWKIIG
ncbi:Phosphatidylglycerol/phosphatidylinositol transfer protein [Wickerhamomyces ciferrii]|uniref:Phosphatidylglycerol/phosphatidylinositol transfer protein n=1 Tax=Wickerhamomyces ciferrii (strain ATCC 14091 / BCRC 22168 / CBS 111 / JCM 3599 / NBRC 0793 / NRRL Y-1031 F-60-10) TaxID=1206466 RepID=K0KN89_WICCF|nr:Phosphatidylglycerol/phosphatidylinositol transfer protein [Wickerhamomyces ciferrii]CCH44456.1 Phosphatidylglycerol/phosphatidylinositol transfer protein [Wickerhamomyces ciferrii]